MRDRRHPAEAVWLALVASGLAALLAPDATLADPLRSHIEALAAERGFQLEGAELIGDEGAHPANRRDTAEQIDRLLANYNFVIARDPSGRIARLTIVGIRAAPTVSAAAPRSSAAHDAVEHYVEAVLTGPNGRPVPLRVMVDTGASTLVLPRSLAEKLGYSEKDVTTVRVQTANGMTSGALSSLNSVRVGAAETRDVAVTFVEDGLLGGKHLLGMSFLSRFRMTIDGTDGTVRLDARGNSD